ncbi:MAG TPA: hypothetical protein VMT55_05070 [Candidatus Sulfotelmatobacter sp.]|nr:hypothetical protein [Candidatus Sulfotelmatobacter sp.]
MVDMGICTVSGCSGLVNGYGQVNISVQYKTETFRPEATRPVGLVSVGAENQGALNLSCDSYEGPNRNICDAISTQLTETQAVESISVKVENQGVIREIRVARGEITDKSAANEALNAVASLCAPLQGDDRDLCGAISTQLKRLAAQSKKPDNGECWDNRCYVKAGGVSYVLCTAGVTGGLGSGTAQDAIMVSQEIYQGRKSRSTEYFADIYTGRIAKSEFRKTGRVLKLTYPEEKLVRQREAQGPSKIGTEALVLADKIYALADNPAVKVNLGTLRDRLRNLLSK